MKKKDELTKKQVSELKALLAHERDSILEKVRDSMTKTVEGGDRQVGDEFDNSDEDNMMYYELRLRNREKGKLRKILHALERIEEGTYNECENCGEPIGYARLKARPIATLCIACKEEQERQEEQMVDDEHAIPQTWNLE